MNIIEPLFMANLALIALIWMFSDSNSVEDDSKLGATSGANQGQFILAGQYQNCHDACKEKLGDEYHCPNGAGRDQPQFGKGVNVYWPCVGGDNCHPLLWEPSCITGVEAEHNLLGKWMKKHCRNGIQHEPVSVYTPYMRNEACYYAKDKGAHEKRSHCWSFANVGGCMNLPDWPPDGTRRICWCAPVTPPDIWECQSPKKCQV